MRGRRDPRLTILTFIDSEGRVPLDCPLRAMRCLISEAPAELSPTFDATYAEVET
jgi:hypothetical protein